MAEREKVIEGLKELRAHFRAMAGIASSSQGMENHLESARIIEDAIDLLKAQEPEECEDTNKARIFCCSVCGYKVHDIFIDEHRFEYPSIHFCPNCGRKVHA